MIRYIPQATGRLSTLVSWIIRLIPVISRNCPEKSFKYLTVFHVFSVHSHEAASGACTIKNRNKTYLVVWFSYLFDSPLWDENREAQLQLLTKNKISVSPMLLLKAVSRLLFGLSRLSCSLPTLAELTCYSAPEQKWVTGRPPVSPPSCA